MNLPTVIYVNKQPVEITAPQMPDEDGAPADQSQRDWLQRFVAVIGPKGIGFYHLATGEKWVASGVNAGAKKYVVCWSPTNSRLVLRPTDWLARYRSIVMP